MTYIIFACLGLGCALAFLLPFVFDKNRVANGDIDRAMAGVKTLRGRLDTITESFVALGNDPILAQAASASADPCLKAYSGETLKYYRSYKSPYLALSFAYNAVARTVQRAETRVEKPMLAAFAQAARTIDNAEILVMVKEIDPAAYSRVVRNSNYRTGAQSAQEHRIGYLITACEALVNELRSCCAAIRKAPADFAAQLDRASALLVSAEGEHAALTACGAIYSPYEERLAAIARMRGELSALAATDPIGAVKQCQDLLRACDSLVAELKQARQLVATVNDGEAKIIATREWVGKVRTTPVTCPWADSRGDDANWRLDSADSDPDGQINQSLILLAEARKNLAAGVLNTVGAGAKQALAAREQAEKMVHALFDAKTAVDEKVPSVRAQLASVRGELHAITGGSTTQELASLVERTCDAVDARIGDVYKLYREQNFTEALALIAGSASNEYGLPVAKLLAQSKELLRLLSEAAKVAGTLTQA